MAEMKLLCTDDEYHALHRDLDRTRQTSETVRVGREALGHLLIDHGRLLARLEREVGHRVA